MAVRMGNSRKALVRTVTVLRADGSQTLVYTYRFSGTDPTSTGTIWRQPMAYEVHRLASGEDVEWLEDGGAVVIDTDEALTAVH